ncbi:MAG: O-antigen ligase family protein [Bryobacteraceae bacterium]
MGYLVMRGLASPIPYYARADIYSAGAALTIYLLTATAFSASGKRIALLVALLAFALCHVLVCLVQFGVGHNLIFIDALKTLEATTRPNGLYGGPDHLAWLLEMLGIFGLSIACWSRRPKTAKVLIGYLALACYIGVAFTGSRGGYLSVGSSLVVFALLSLIALRSGGGALFWRWGAIGLIVLVSVAIAGSSLMQKSKTLSNRLANIVTVDHGRLDLWRAAIKQWKLQPWIGTGSGTYRFYGREFRGEQMQQDPVAVHNDYLHLLGEYGIVGAVAFLLFLGIHLLRGWEGFRRLGPERVAAGTLPLGDRLALNIGALSAITAGLVHSLVDFNLHIPANAFLLALTFGFLANRGVTPVEEWEQKGSSLQTRHRCRALILLSSADACPGEYFANRARVALAEENPATAIEFTKRALTHEQANPKILFYLGRALVAVGSQDPPGENRNAYYEAALAAFDKARLLNPLEGSYPLEMALVYDDLGRFDEAEWMYGLARARDPNWLGFGDYYRTHLRTWEQG